MYLMQNGTDEKFNGNVFDAVDVEGHSSALVDIDRWRHKSDAIDVDKDLVGDEKDIKIDAGDGLVSSKGEEPVQEKKKFS
jgi:hypothetical protein